MLVSCGQIICSFALLLTLLLTESCMLHCGINLVSSDSEVPSSIETGKVASDAAQDSLVAKMSNGANQVLWWMLANTKWHSDAALRYFEAGPLRPKEMDALAAKNGRQDPPKPDDVQGPTDFLHALQNISTNLYELNSFIKGTGQIKASMWTLMFQCYSESCIDGMVPMIIFNDRKDLFYATVWLPLSMTMVVNAPPSSINRLRPAKNYVPDPSYGPDISDVSLVLNVQDNQSIQLCPDTALARSRTILDTAFGLIPGSSCVQIHSKKFNDSLRILFSLGFPDDENTDRAANDKDLIRFMSNLLGDSGNLSVLQFSECYREVVLTMDNHDHHSIQVCLNASCVSYDWHNISCTSASNEFLSHEESGYLKLATLVAIANTRTCTDESVCTSRPTHEVVCNVTILTTDNYSTAFLLVTLPISNWTKSKGVYTSEFYNQSLKESLHPCMLRFSGNGTLGSASPSKQPITLPGEIESRARAYLRSHISQHNTAFTTEEGVATDLQTFIALVVSTAIAVVFGDVAGLFTNIYFSCRLKFKHTYLEDHATNPAHMRASVAFQVVFILVACILFFLPVLAVAWTEIQREKLFHTWNVASNDFYYGDLYESQIRVVYLLSATSSYNSHFLATITIVVSLTCILAAWRSFHRSNRIFARYKMLKAYDGTDDNELRKVKYISLRAIEMTNSEYLEIKNRLEQRHPPHTPTSPVTSSSNARISVVEMSSSKEMPSSTEMYSQPMRQKNYHKTISLPANHFAGTDESPTAPLFRDRSSSMEREHRG